MLKNIAALFVLIFMIGCKDIEEINEMKVTGQVIDDVSKAPLDSATVSLYEDNDGAFMGRHLLQTAVTDKNGNYSFNFTYKEGPYTIFVNRRGYVYQRWVKDKILNLESISEHQEVEAFKNDQHIVFGMQPLADLTIKVKNVAPALTNDQITINVGKAPNNKPAFTRTYDGIVDLDLPLGQNPAARYTRIYYTVLENNVTRSVKDSVYLEPGKRAVYNLEY